jgi:hypothetical protein
MLNNRSFLIKVFLILVSVESAFTFYMLTAISSDPKNSVLFGFSASRLLLIGGVLGIFLVTFISSIWLLRSYSNINRAVNTIDTFFSNSNKQIVFISTCIIFIGIGILFLLTPVERLGEAVVQRITSVVLLLTFTALQLLIVWFLWVQKKIYWFHLAEWKSPLKISAIIFSGFILFWIGIAWSGLGIKREPSGWLSQGTPLLSQQLLFAWGIGLIFITFRNKLDQYKRTDLVIGIFLWLTTSLIWWQEPMLRESYFTPEPTPPNFEYYPYSDAALYDSFSQNFLIGASRQIGLTHRPLYSLFLALLHTLGGYGFQNVLWMQTLCLAFIPVIGYLLASRLGGRAAGILAALLLIFREKNSIALTNIIEVSHVKLIMSDVPTMLLMLLFIYFYVKWLQDKNNRLILGLLAGVFFGLTIFIRSQAQLLIPIVLLGLILSYKFTWKAFLQRSLVFLIGVFAVLAPWVFRNYQLSGRAVVEYQGFYTRFIASSYSSSPTDNDRLPSETNEEYEARMRTMIINFILNNPAEVARFYSSYFLHNEIATLAYLPMSLRFDTLQDYVDIYGFWDAPYLGEMPIRTFPALFIILGVIALGIGTAFNRYRWIGVMPLLFHLGYSFSVVPVKQSGWRFILPVDWVSILYLSIGLVQLSMLAFSLFSEKKDDQSITNSSTPELKSVNWQWVTPALVAFTIFGISLPFIEWSVPKRYPKLSSSELIQHYVPEGVTLSNGEQVGASELESFIETEAAPFVMHGRALYPAYYEQEQYWGELNPTLADARQHNRLQFYLIEGRFSFIFLPLEEAPSYFPHASDIFVIGCMQENSLRALLVKVNDEILVSSPWHGLNCSVTE